MATEEANIIDHGILACHPLESHSARVDAIRVKANARDDVIPTFGGFQQGLGTADTLECRCSIGEQYARDAGMQADQNCVGL